MTEKRRIPEQIAIHDYSRSMSTPVARHVNTRRRVVTVPDAVPQAAWNDYVERRDRLHARRSRTPQARVHEKMALRTLAQTGIQAPDGLVRPIKRLPQYQTPVPVRSGRHNGHNGRNGGNNRHGFWWRLLGFFTLLTLIVLGTVFVLTNPFFRIEHLNIVGTHNPLLVHSIQQMGIRGQNIFLIDVASLTNRIDTLPVVANASMEKQWPNQMVITVTERTPVLLWQTRQGTYSVDTSGMVIAPASETMGAKNLRVVVDVRKGDNATGRGGNMGVRPGTRLNAADIAFAMQVFARLPQMTGVTNFTLRYGDTMPAPNGSMGDNGVFEVVSQAGWVAYLGGSNDTNPLDNRLIELQQILALAQQQQLNIATIDLRYGLRPVYTLKS